MVYYMRARERERGAVWYFYQYTRVFSLILARVYNVRGLHVNIVAF